MNQETIAIHLKEGNKFKRQGELEKAIACYKLAIELNPNSSWFYHIIRGSFGQTMSGRRGDRLLQKGDRTQF